MLIFDLLRLPRAAVEASLGRVLADPAVLKLGVGFEADLRLLHRSYPWPCFCRVENYLEVRRVCAWGGGD